MADYRLSKTADQDIERIAVEGMAQFGVEQALHYHKALEACFDAIAARPLSYPPADIVRAGYRRCVFESHVVYFRMEPAGVEIVRVLHQRMDVDSAMGTGPLGPTTPSPR